MARYDNEEVTRIFRERALDAVAHVYEADLTLMDMLGYFAWTFVQHPDESEDKKQKALLGAILIAYAYGRTFDDAVELPDEMSDFVATLNLDPPKVQKITDLMGW